MSWAFSSTGPLSTSRGHSGSLNPTHNLATMLYHLVRSMFSLISGIYTFSKHKTQEKFNKG